MEFFIPPYREVVLLVNVLYEFCRAGCSGVTRLPYGLFCLLSGHIRCARLTREAMISVAAGKRMKVSRMLLLLGD